MTLDTLPLLVHPSPASIAAYRGGKPISAGQLLADATRLRNTMPAALHVLNICADRYQFAVGLLASIMAGKTSLLSPSLVPEVVKHLRAFAPDAFCLADDDAPGLPFPMLRLPESATAPSAVNWQVPQIPCDQEIAYVFTSGSTGTPLPHRKTWGTVARNVRVEAQRLHLDDGRSHVIVATVPVQHMYGLETSLLVVLQSGQAFCAEHPFYPADIASALAAVPRPRMLASTPLHLNALLAVGIELPQLDLVVCATAPLDARIALEIERRFGAPLMEIYGSTETGQIASRRTAETDEWQLWPDVRLSMRDGQTWAHGGTVAEPTALGDVVETTADDRFMLRGRTEDMVNIAGKRSSLAYLSHQLTAIPGVVDGIFFLREDVAQRSSGATTRLSAIAVAPGLTVEAILRELRLRVEPVFLPRPLRLVEHIERNSTGKLRRDTLNALIK